MQVLEECKALEAIKAEPIPIFWVADAEAAQTDEAARNRAKLLDFLIEWTE